MSTDFVTSGAVKDGVLKIRNRQAIEGWAKRQRDCELTVTIEKAHATRSLEQNRLYWVGYVNPLVEYTGYSAKEIHEYLKQRFLPTHTRQVKRMLIQDANGEVIDSADIDISTTTKLNRVEFSEYLHEVQQFAIGLGVTVGSHHEVT